MSSTKTSYQPEQPTKLSDPYASTPEMVPEPDSKPTYTPNESNDDADKGEIHINGEAYNALTKPDPHYATSFSPSEVRGETWESDFLYSDRELYFRMLSAINRGERNGPTWEHSELHTHSLREHLVEVIGAMLNLNDLQLDEAKARATNVHGEKFGMSLELLVYCVCAYVVHNDNTPPYAKERKVHPNCESKDVIFLRVAFELDLRPNLIDRVYRRFEQEFTEVVPPKGFDSRKPGWKPGCTDFVRCKPEQDFSTKAGRWMDGLTSTGRA